MKPIANIITSLKRVDFELAYNKCKDLSEIDKSLPTLIIGYEKAKESINGFNILKKQYPEQNIWWTFNKNERKTDYDTDIRKFYEDVLNKIVNSIVYENIDVISETSARKRKMLRYLVSDDKKVIYNHYGKVLFVYSPRYKRVWGLSLSTLRFFGYEPKKIIKLAKRNSNNNQINGLVEIPLSIKRTFTNDIPKQIALYEYFS